MTGLGVGIGSAASGAFRGFMRGREVNARKNSGRTMKWIIGDKNLQKKEFEISGPDGRDRMSVLLIILRTLCSYFLR